MDDIARAAGTSHGAFYLYFQNKQDILETLATETAERMYALTRRLEGIEPGEEGFERLHGFIEEFVEAYGEHSAVVTAWTAAAEDDRFDRLGREVLGNFSKAIAHVIESRVRRNGRHPVDPGIAATALVAMLERFSYFWLVRGAAFRREVAIDTLTALCYEAIFGADVIPG